MPDYGYDILVWVFCIVIGCVLWRVFTGERNEMEQVMTTKTVSKEDLLNCYGDFTWSFGSLFLIETEFGMFVWSDPGYNGNNVIRPYDGRIKDFFNPYGRMKGRHLVSRYCGDQFTFITTPYGKE